MNTATADLKKKKKKSIPRCSPLSIDNCLKPVRHTFEEAFQPFWGNCPPKSIQSNLQSTHITNSPTCFP